MLKAGDVVLVKLQFADTFEIKKRPALVLYEAHDNIVVAGITSNLNMKGIPITKEEGLMKDSVVKLNYIFTTSSILIERVLTSLSDKKKKQVYVSMMKKLSGLNQNRNRNI